MGWAAGSFSRDSCAPGFRGLWKNLWKNVSDAHINKQVIVCSLSSKWLPKNFPLINQLHAGARNVAGLLRRGARAFRASFLVFHKTA
jgi:hypothetical protein